MARPRVSTTVKLNGVNVAMRAFSGKGVVANHAPDDADAQVTWPRPRNPVKPPADVLGSIPLVAGDDQSDGRVEVQLMGVAERREVSVERLGRAPRAPRTGVRDERRCGGQLPIHVWMLARLTPSRSGAHRPTRSREPWEP